MYVCVPVCIYASMLIEAGLETPSQADALAAPAAHGLPARAAHGGGRGRAWALDDYSKLLGVPQEPGFCWPACVRPFFFFSPVGFSCVFGEFSVLVAQQDGLQL